MGKWGVCWAFPHVKRKKKKTIEKRKGKLVMVSWLDYALIVGNMGSGSVVMTIVGAFTKSRLALDLSWQMKRLRCSAF